MHLIKIYDCDIYLLKFLDITSIINLKELNHTLNKIIINSKIFNEIRLFKNKCNNRNQLICCYQYGLLKILKSYYRNNENIFIVPGIDIASENGHIKILKWFKKKNLRFQYSEWAIDSAS